ncbi:MAG: hypothetical protein ACJ8AO_14605 [Gemmatimonadaceae bacterium]
MRTFIGIALALLVVACDRLAASRAASRADSGAASHRTAPAVAAKGPIPADSYLFLDTMPTIGADDVAVGVVDSSGLGGVPMCAPLENVNFVFRRAVGMMVYCAEDGCDTPYPAKIALTRDGDTLHWESSPTSGEIDRDARPRVHYAWTGSRRLASRLGVRPGMSVGQILALGETVDVDAYEAVVVPQDSGVADTLREGPRALTLYLRREGIVAEVRDDDSVATYFTRNLMPGRPSREALDTAARVDAIGVQRDRCR